MSLRRAPQHAMCEIRCATCTSAHLHSLYHRATRTVGRPQDVGPPLPGPPAPLTADWAAARRCTASWRWRWGRPPRRLRSAHLPARQRRRCAGGTRLACPRRCCWSGARQWRRTWRHTGAHPSWRAVPAAAGGGGRGWLCGQLGAARGGHAVLAGAGGAGACRAGGVAEGGSGGGRGGCAEGGAEIRRRAAARGAHRRRGRGAQRAVAGGGDAVGGGAQEQSGAGGGSGGVGGARAAHVARTLLRGAHHADPPAGATRAAPRLQDARGRARRCAGGQEGQARHEARPRGASLRPRTNASAL
eukprot:5592888-Pyramimonas_sp.AAC.2